MGLEIERKWIVEQERLPIIHPKDIHRITQLYLVDVNKISIRARLIESAGQDRGVLTLKGPSDVEGAVGEYEMDIPAEYVRTLIRTTDMVVVKDRYHVNLANPGLIAEIDVFDGWHKGLIVAEVEFDSPDQSKEFSPPCWFGREVTGNKSYANVNLAKKKSKFWLTS